MVFLKQKSDLFDSQLQQRLAGEAPLADRMRPETLDDFVGQEDIIGEGKLLRRAVLNDELFSIIFWGPPGSGKTTLARIIAKATKSYFESISATSSGLADLRKVVEAALERRKMHSERTILFVDEIHRWNKAQQDALLPFVENGTITLIGATTENPSFEVNSVLLSRCRVFVIKPLSEESIKTIISRVMADKERGFGNYDIKADELAIDYLAQMSNGDARTALNAFEAAFKASRREGQKVVQLNQEMIKEALQRSHLLYDRAGEEHYNIISALHKSMRGSDPDAALYWLARMLEAGEDPLYIARRLIRFASEDIGLADPAALTQATAAYTASHYIGIPECNVVLAQAVAYLAKAPKSNALYRAYGEAQSDVESLGNQPVPLHLRNAPTKLMKNIGYGAGYKYNPDYDEPVDQEYFPEKLKGRKYLEE